MAKNAEPEPRLTVSPQGPAIYGVDLEALPAGVPAVVSDSAASYPVSLY